MISCKYRGTHCTSLSAVAMVGTVGSTSCIWNIRHVQVATIVSICVCLCMSVCLCVCASVCDDKFLYIIHRGRVLSVYSSLRRRRRGRRQRRYSITVYDLEWPQTAVSRSQYSLKANSLSRKRCIRSTPCLVLGKGFRGRRIAWFYFRFDNIGHLGMTYMSLAFLLPAH